MRLILLFAPTRSNECSNRPFQSRAPNPCRSGSTKIEEREGAAGGLSLGGQNGKISMARQRRSPEEPLLKSVLARTRELAQEVRETAERVHHHAREAHRLTELARQQTERGRELSKAGRDEARAVVDSIRWSIDSAGNGRRRAAGKGEN